MSELKPGDRVRVEFEATVVQAKDAWRQIEVVADGKRETTWVQPGDCTLIEPEIVLPEIPGTIVQVDPTNKHGVHQIFYFEFPSPINLGVTRIWRSGQNNYSTAHLSKACRAYGYRVIPAAETKGVSE